MRIKMGVRGLILGFMGVALITLIQVGPVYAINTAYLDLNLTNWNVDDIQSTGDYIHVTATNVGSNT
ncbi:MAG TPA: hypothetical protein VFG95_02700, partial [Nitrospiria bacterium]|nr:hypothetical protein [Nitrospiria bacterium]